MASRNLHRSLGGMEVNGLEKSKWDTLAGLICMPNAASLKGCATLKDFS